MKARAEEETLHKSDRSRGFDDVKCTAEKHFTSVE